MRRFRDARTRPHHRLPEEIVDDVIVRVCESCAPADTLGRWYSMQACADCGTTVNDGVFVRRVVVTARQVYIGTPEEGRQALAFGIASGFPAACAKNYAVTGGNVTYIKTCAHPEHNIEPFQRFARGVVPARHVRRRIRAQPAVV